MSRQLSLLPQDYIVLDVETRHSAQEVGGWGSLGLMGVSVAVLFDSRAGTFTAYTQDAIPEMAELLASGPLVVGFNTLSFDYPVLAPHAPDCDFKKIRSLDMLAKIHRELGFRVSLDNLAGATLGANKSAHGLQALQWWKEQRLDLIEEYCRQDVALTKDLYIYGMENGYLYYTDRQGTKHRVQAAW